MIDPKDGALIREILAWCNEHPDDAEERRLPVRQFKSMRDLGFPLSDDQRSWVKSVYERLFDKPVYENLVSSGRAPRGREVPDPPVLQRENLPKKPPTRRKEDEDD